MARRSQARELALQSLYQWDLNPESEARQMRAAIEARLRDDELAAFCWQLVAGTIEHQAELDARIEAAAENWSLSRMAPTDRNALRLGAFELLYTSTPPRVIIDEAIELARKFGTKNSSQFVNGILDKLLHAQDSDESE